MSTLHIKVWTPKGKIHRPVSNEQEAIKLSRTTYKGMRVKVYGTGMGENRLHNKPMRSYCDRMATNYR